MSHEEIMQYAIARAHYKARQIMDRHGYVDSDFYDIRQELLVEVIERLPEFNGRLAGAKTFVCMLIDNRIVDLIKARLAECRNPGQEECSLDDWVRGEDGAWERRDTGVDIIRRQAHCGAFPRSGHEQADLAMDVQHIVAALPPKLRDLCERLKTQSVPEIANETGLTRTTAYRLARLVRKRLKARGMDAYRP